ncbi:MAG: endo-1,4-beta-xylanase [Beijerinckiaceae bacterium]|nr:endo-1,4-beta-xylanase [Beijerinckiaceae bacterium]
MGTSPALGLALFEQRNAALSPRIPSSAGGQPGLAAALLAMARKRVFACAAALFFVIGGSFYDVHPARAGSTARAGIGEPVPSVDVGKDDPRDDGSPWGAASGAEWFGAYPRFNPLLREAGVSWLRGFPGWNGIQPKQGQWNWTRADALVANARANNIHIAGMFVVLPAWASADGKPFTFPIKDMQYWRDFVSAVVTRYHNEIKYWEIWNEFDGGFAVNGTPKIYADLVRDAYDAAKSIDPTAMIGMNVANFDVGFLDRAIKAGAADHFNFVTVHPYEILAGVRDYGEVYFLSMADTLRRMLAANSQRVDIPLWITEIGALAPIAPDPDGDRLQAEALVKAYLLSIASGFQRIFWFEARGPDYNGRGDHGLIRPDWTPRPSYAALKTITDVLGRQPRYLGWLDLDSGGYGFLFDGRGGNVLAAWSPAMEQRKVKFAADVHVIGLAGNDSVLKAGQELTLTATPALIAMVPGALADQARRNAGKPFPWLGDYAHASAISCRLQDTNLDDGLRQINPETSVPAEVDGVPSRRIDFTRPAGRYVLFRADPQFAPFGTTSLEITAVVRRVAPDLVAGLNLEYESLKGYVGAPPWFTIPADEQWHELTWKVSAANFAGAWGYNFRLNAFSSPNELYVREVRVKKSAASQ